MIENMEMELKEETNNKDNQELNVNMVNNEAESQKEDMNIIEDSDNKRTETLDMSEVVYYPMPKEKVIEPVIKDPDCCYWECCTNEFCDKCGRKCDGRIKAKGHKAQTMDQSKMCLKLEGDPDVYYITKKESEKLISGDKVAYLEVKIDPRVIKDNSVIRVFFGVKDDEE